MSPQALVGCRISADFLSRSLQVHQAFNSFTRSDSVWKALTSLSRFSWKRSVVCVSSADVWKHCGRSSALLNRPSTHSRGWSHFYGNEEDEWKQDGGQTTYRPQLSVCVCVCSRISLLYIILIIIRGLNQTCCSSVCSSVIILITWTCEVVVNNHHSESGPSSLWRSSD